MVAKTAVEVKANYIDDYYAHGGPDYNDVPPPGSLYPSPFFKEIETLYIAGVINNRREFSGGGNGGTFYEGGTVTRAMAAQFIHEVLYAVSPP